MEGSWDRLGVLLAPLRPVSDRLSPPWGGPGEAPGGHFWRYFGVIFGSIFGAQAEKVKMIIFQVFVMFVWVLSLFYVLPSVAFLAAWPAAPRIYKKHEIPLVFLGRKPNVPFSRSARSKQISEGTRSKKRLNISSKMRTQGLSLIHI